MKKKNKKDGFRLFEMNKMSDERKYVYQRAGRIEAKIFLISA